MKTNKIIYWTTTGIVSLMMLFSGIQYFINPDLKAAFIHLGFPDYFRVELGTAKLIGALLLIIPQITGRVKEWMYAGFGITFISAVIAHIHLGDPASAIVPPFVFLLILIVSNQYLHKVKDAVIDHPLLKSGSL